MPGWIYAMVTPSMPCIVKFGATERDPEERLREANAPDTFRPPEPYVIAAATEVDDPFAVERGIHAILASRRIHPRREFFRFTTDEARALLALVPAHVEEAAGAIDATATIEQESYQARKARFELSHFATACGTPFHSVDGNGNVVSLWKHAFTAAHENWTHAGRQFLEQWYTDAQKRSYERVEHGFVRDEDKLRTVYYVRSPTSAAAERRANSGELAFLHDTLVSATFGQEFVARFRTARAGHYAIPSSMLCSEYNRWRAERGATEPISSKSFTWKMVSHGDAYGIRRDTSGNRHNTFRIDASALRAALIN